MNQSRGCANGWFVIRIRLGYRSDEFSLVTGEELRKYLLSRSTLLAGATITLIGSVTHAEQSVRVPKQGIYSHSAPGTNRLYESRDAGNVEGFLEVSNCGNTLRLSTKTAPPLVLNYANGNWRGELSGNGGSIEYKIETLSDVELNLGLKFPHGESEPSRLVLVEEAENSGFAEIIEMKTEKTRESLYWVMEETTYGLNLDNFGINRSELLPEHEAAIEEVMSILLDEHQQGGFCSERLKPHVAEDVLGYASQTGPERVNRRLASARASEVAAYINQYRADVIDGTGFEFPRVGAKGASVPSQADFPNLETKCNRRAFWQFTVRRRYVDPYSTNDAESWLRDDLRMACASGETTNDRDKALSGEEGARRRARARYALAMNFLGMMDAGHCKPQDSDPAKVAQKLFDSSVPTSIPEPPDFRDSVRAAYDLADKDNIRNLFSGGLRSEKKRQTEQLKMSSDPYYCYSYKQNPSAIERSRNIEEEECGSVLLAVGEADQNADYEIGAAFCDRYHRR